ncbi:MAG: endonuclease/exonuclease/phosphatase family protein [Phycisphaeraceae bacterium]|nr:endonuclease/exonuclease/phosphatase family protein [Phycisphaeraceae bacterium]
MIDDGQQLDLEAAPFRATRSKRRTATWLLLISGGLPMVATLLGFLGLIWWPFELLANYRFQYAFILTGVILAAMMSKRWIWATLLCLPLALNLALIVPLYLPTDLQLQTQTTLPKPIAKKNQPPANNHSPDSHILKHDDSQRITINGQLWRTTDEPLLIMNLNMNVAERGSEHVMQLINEGGADLILAHSVTQATLKQLTMYGTPYRIHSILPRDDEAGMALLARVSLPPKIRITHTAILDLANSTLEAPAIEATLQWLDRPIHLLLVHLTNPWSSRAAKTHNQQIKNIVQWVNKQAHPVIVMGNFSATPWAAHFSDLLRKTGLINSQVGFGIQPTWPANGGFPLGEIPVDHCLHSESLVTVERGLGPTNGADHRPLILKLTWSDPHPYPPQTQPKPTAKKTQ